MVLKPELPRHNAALTGSNWKVTVPPLPGRRDVRHDFLQRFEIKVVGAVDRSIQIKDPNALAHRSWVSAKRSKVNDCHATARMPERGQIGYDEATCKG